MNGTRVHLSSRWRHQQTSSLCHPPQGSNWKLAHQFSDGARWSMCASARSPWPCADQTHVRRVQVVHDIWSMSAAFQQQLARVLRRHQLLPSACSHASHTAAQATEKEQRNPTSCCPAAPRHHSPCFQPSNPLWRHAVTAHKNKSTVAPSSANSCFANSSNLYVVYRFRETSCPQWSRQWVQHVVPLQKQLTPHWTPTQLSRLQLDRCKCKE